MRTCLTIAWCRAFQSITAVAFCCSAAAAWAAFEASRHLAGFSFVALCAYLALAFVFASKAEDLSYIIEWRGGKVD